MEIRIVLLTNHRLNTDEMAKKVYNLLCSYNETMPTHFDQWEPIKIVFPNNQKEFINLWCFRKKGDLILWKRKKSLKFGGHVNFKNSYGFNELLWTIELKKTDTIQKIKPFINNIINFFAINQFLFGFICSTEEYYLNNILKNTPFYFNNKGEKIYHPPGYVSPILPVGLDLRKHIPGLYWITLFGKIYVDWFGKEKMKTAPAYKVFELPNDAIGYQLYEDPAQYQEEESQETARRVKQYLGEKAFFDISDIDRETIAPYIDVSEIR